MPATSCHGQPGLCFAGTLVIAATGCVLGVGVGVGVGVGAECEVRKVQRSNCEC
ncbi:hypothetical protein K504DRAFT_461108 [Pleomassaria siparia CBS 279.74]|uniref:Uncharacterized protein n=1 Tax=Pleomassaria siparia CBS 279.74 TaxID=1314801 RepID=A0A6G1JWJ2_9PLEO|nr:hypothetical protein K504DRAFT_461108 [Pleomassaria siparia CBS 279.74]